MSGDAYYTRVEQQLRDLRDTREFLDARIRYLNGEMATVVEGVVLKPPPLDREFLSGSPDPLGKIESDLQQIAQERYWCRSELCAARYDLEEIRELEGCLRDLHGIEGRVLRGLYLHKLSWAELRKQLRCAQTTLAYHRQRGIERVVLRLRARTP